jgi:hypothetical protein
MMNAQTVNPVSKTRRAPLMQRRPRLISRIVGRTQRMQRIIVGSLVGMMEIVALNRLVILVLRNVAIPIFKEVLISFVALVSLANQKNEDLQTALHCNNYVNVILSQTFVMQPSNVASLAPQGMMRIVR